jgi:hypothetical protein
MGVLQVTRINPQPLATVQVSMADSDKIADLLAKVSKTPLPGYNTESNTGAAYAAQGGWRIAFKRDDYPSQMAYPSDWILVTDATYSTDPNPDAPGEVIGWVLADTSEVFVYGISAGLAGTADDFVNTFTAAT